MSKIITVTANTAIDYSVQVSKLALGNNIQAKCCTEFASGKGINVAKAVESLKHPVYALGFVGRQSTTIFNAVKSHLLHIEFTTVDGKTRTNITLSDDDQQRETHIRTAGFSVTDADCQRLIDRIDSHAWKGDIVVLSGSLPGGAPSSLYRTIIELCHRKSAIPFLDSSGASLIEGLQAQPYLVKPNLRELEELTGNVMHDENDIVAAAREIVAQGIHAVVVSRGAKGVVAVFDHSAEVVSVIAETDKIVSKIGSGDAVVAGLAVAKAKGLQLPDAVKLGAACGTANLYSIEPGRFELDQAEKLRTEAISRPL